MMQPQVGARFQHRRVLDENNQPAIYEVTRIAQGAVWFKQPEERKAKEWCPVEEWSKVCKDGQ